MYRHSVRVCLSLCACTWRTLPKTNSLHDYMLIYHFLDATYKILTYKMNTHRKHTYTHTQQTLQSFSSTCSTHRNSTMITTCFALSLCATHCRCVSSSSPSSVRPSYAKLFTIIYWCREIFLPNYDDDGCIDIDNGYANEIKSL